MQVYVGKIKKDKILKQSERERMEEVQQGESGFIIKTMRKRVTFNVLE